jgi:tetrahydromethanopterin S-methyltransferase subunit F
LEEARGQIIKLHSEISELREENISLKQMLNTSGNTKDVVQLRQKIQYLTADNQRLESERTQIIADKITT